MRAPPLTPIAAAVLHVPVPERILVLGRMTADAALFLAREFPAARIRGVETSPEAVREAAGRVGLDPEGRLAFKVGSRRALPFPDELFDLLVALDTRPAVGETLRVLRSPGYLVVARTKQAGRPARARDALLAYRLRRRGVETLAAERAGDGSFRVAWRGVEGEAAHGD